MGENNFSAQTLALYGIILLMAAIAYYILQTLILIDHGKDSRLAKAIGSDYKGKASPVLYILAIASTLYSQWIAGGLYLLVALMWLIPDKRIEKTYQNSPEE